MTIREILAKLERLDRREPGFNVVHDAQALAELTARRARDLDRLILEIERDLLLTEGTL